MPPPIHHDDVIKRKHLPRYWPFVRGIHRLPVNSPHKGQWHGALMFSLICAWINGWVNNREAGDLRRHRPHFDVIVMTPRSWQYGHHLITSHTLKSWWTNMDLNMKFSSRPSLYFNGISIPGKMVLIHSTKKGGLSQPYRSLNKNIIKSWMPKQEASIRVLHA